MTLTARYGALTDIGLHRKTNEDALLASPPLFAVCDGMGGAQAGEVASGLAIETLAAVVGEGRPLLDAAEAANAAIFARASAHAEQSGMGTTLTALILEGEAGHFVHVGDSRAYLLRDDVLEQLSDDHSLVGELVREGRLTPAEASVHPHRSILTRALGTEARVLIDEFEVDLLAGDVLLLCSDGLSGTVPAADIARLMGCDDPEAAARKLVALARKHGGHDNITALVVRLGAGATGEPALEARTLVIPPDDEAATRFAATPAGAEAPATVDADVSAGAVAPPAGEPDAVEAAPGAGPDSGAAPEHRRRRRLGCLVGVLAVAVAVALAGVFGLSSVYYVGVDQGRLAVYSGVPLELGPLPLHAVYRQSALEYTALSPAQRLLVDRGELRSKGAAMGEAKALGMWQ